MPPRLPLLCLAVLSLAAVAAPAADSPMTLLTAANPAYRYEGRLDRTEAAAPVLIWSGSRVNVDFGGDRLAIQFGPVSGQCVFNVTVDGHTEIVDLRAATWLRYVWPRPLAAGRHHVEIFKRTEASKGHAAFRGVELAAGAELWAPPAPDYRLKMAFFGDSITVGACNEDGATDQWDDYRTHNYALSWAHLTAENFQADDRVAAYSGMGVVTGWETVKAREIWDKVYPRPDSPRADFSAWQADVVFVNWGENDSSFTEAHKQPFPPDFAAGYVSVVKSIRAAYPRAQIVLLRGGMTGGAQDADYRAAWEAAVRELEAGDPRMSHFVFKYFAKLHPRVAEDRTLAAGLTAWLKQQPFMAPYLGAP